jgi:ketopantoate reductase
MKTLIIGTGVIGTLYGWALTEAGADVTHFVRPGKSGQFTEGVTMDVLDERKGHPTNNNAQYKIHCVEEIRPEDGYELVIVPVNANQLEEALKTVTPYAGKAIFLTLTSNWEGTKILDTYLPRERYLMGYADGGGTIRNGVYWTNLGAEIHLGEVNGERSEKLQRVNALFEQADMKPDIPNNIVHWLWVHNATVIGFAAGFAKHKELQKYLKDSELLKTSLKATRELLALCKQRGVNLRDYPDISYINWPDWLVLATMRWMYTTNKSMQRYTAHAASPASLSETKLHYNAMIKTAEETGSSTPALRSLATFLDKIDD